MPELPLDVWEEETRRMLGLPLAGAAGAAGAAGGASFTPSFGPVGPEAPVPPSGKGFHLAGAKKDVASRGFSEMLSTAMKTGKFGPLLKTPGGLIGAAFLAQFLVKYLMGQKRQISGMGLQREALEQQAGVSPEDAYFQAALPGLTQERQAAQMALMQAIMGGRGQPVQVPGEVRI
jgi:hypothetical protein